MLSILTEQDIALKILKPVMTDAWMETTDRLKAANAMNPVAAPVDIIPGLLMQTIASTVQWALHSMLFIPMELVHVSNTWPWLLHHLMIMKMMVKKITCS
jgi:hypothetical protein